mmetsp:Transcript_14465/g.28884  ORF Transcript_14465/g.28884 Transcript_14465/m.28884 type:complete len:206 (-) Transcript_14465:79-696(-)
MAALLARDAQVLLQCLYPDTLVPYVHPDVTVAIEGAEGEHWRAPCLVHQHILHSECDVLQGLIRDAMLGLGRKTAHCPRLPQILDVKAVVGADFLERLLRHVQQILHVLLLPSAHLCRVPHRRVHLLHLVPCLDSEEIITLPPHAVEPVCDLLWRRLVFHLLQQPLEPLLVPFGLAGVSRGRYNRYKDARVHQLKQGINDPLTRL